MLTIPTATRPRTTPATPREERSSSPEDGLGEHRESGGAHARHRSGDADPGAGVTGVEKGQAHGDRRPAHRPPAEIGSGDIAVDESRDPDHEDEPDEVRGRGHDHRLRPATPQPTEEVRGTH